MNWKSRAELDAVTAANLDPAVRKERAMERVRQIRAGTYVDPYVQRSRGVRPPGTYSRSFVTVPPRPVVTDRTIKSGTVRDKPSWFDTKLDFTKSGIAEYNNS